MKAELIDVMGTDLTVVNAARVSFDKESSLVDSDEECSNSQAWEGMTGQKLFKQVLSEKDQRLVKYLATHNHWSPFSHVMITMRETVPIFVARQRFKHMVGFTYNEVSRRYVSDEPTFYRPDEWREAADNKKQGSGGKHPLWNHGVGTGYLDELDEFYEDVLHLYNRMIGMGVAPEQARMVLPQSMYTSYYTTGSLAAWARAYKLRSDEHSQKEIRDLADQWNNIIRNIPELKYSWSALVD